MRFYKPGEYRVNQENEFLSVSTGLPLNPGDLAGLEAYSEPDDISPLETYGKEVCSQNRTLVTVNGVKKLCKAAVIRI